MSMPFRIGLTGGIGSGKSTVANYFQDLGIEIIDADIIARLLTAPETTAYKKIHEHFGDIILNLDKSINRRKLRELIFSDPTEKRWLEELLHPMIRARMQQDIIAVKSPYCVCVIPLLAEATGIDFIDRVLVIETPIETQLERAKIRDKSSKAAIQTIIDAQADQNKRRLIADDIIINDCSLDTLKVKVKKLHQFYLAMAQQS